MNVSSSQDDGAKEPANLTSLAPKQLLDLLGMIPYAAIVVDEAGRIVAVNGLAEQLFDYTGTNSSAFPSIPYYRNGISRVTRSTGQDTWPTPKPGQCLTRQYWCSFTK